ncbi:hypothetical protein BGZ94_008069 [Podila epigama]|nr:hypothetical protein BGZ94_008069 [Podila epigama]
MFYTAQYQGIILVHDVCNKRSYDNLWKWMKDYMDVANTRAGANASLGSFSGATGGLGIPVLVIGTKKDLMSGYEPSYQRSAGDDIAGEYGGESITLSANSLVDLMPSSHTCMAINMFLDRVLDPSQPAISQHRHQLSKEPAPYPSRINTQSFTSQNHTQSSGPTASTSPLIPIVDFASFTGVSNSMQNEGPTINGHGSRSSTPSNVSITPPPGSSHPVSNSPHRHPSSSVRVQYERNRSILGQYGKSGVPTYTQSRT